MNEPTAYPPEMTVREFCDIACRKPSEVIFDSMKENVFLSIDGYMKLAHVAKLCSEYELDLYQVLEKARTNRRTPSPSPTQGTEPPMEDDTRYDIMPSVREELRNRREALTASQAEVATLRELYQTEATTAMEAVDEMNRAKVERDTALAEVAALRRALKSSDSVLKWLSQFHGRLPDAADGTPAWHIIDGALNQILAALSPESPNGKGEL